MTPDIHILVSHQPAENHGHMAAERVSPVAKFGLYEGFLGLASAACVGLLTVLVGFQYVQSGTLGEHGNELQNIAKRFDESDTALKEMEGRLTKRFDNIDKRLDEIEVAIDMRSLNLKTLVAQMGVVQADANFEALIYDGSLWALPVDTTVIGAFEKAGLKKEQINGALSGFRLRSIDYVAANRPAGFLEKYMQDSGVQFVPINPSLKDNGG